MNTLKGVNKQIVEINYTRDDYVEKAILIINPEKKHLGQSIINRKAQSYMESLQLPPARKKAKRYLPLLKASLYILLGASLMAFVLSFLPL